MAVSRAALAGIDSSVSSAPDLSPTVGYLGELDTAYAALPTPPSGVIDPVIVTIDDLEVSVVGLVDDAILQI